MDYRREQNTIFLRVDKGEELLETIKKICVKENLGGGYFQGIGACDRVVISTWIPEKEDYSRHNLTGMLELVSLTGNISTDEGGTPVPHSHAIFSFLADDGSTGLAAGHLEEAWISYTGEVILTFAAEKIGRIFDAEAGIEVWDLA